ncbi:MAG: flagellar hook-length control protein FliK [Chromatiaceae bacterium]|jgi:flagellar hook-length control protein FliK
MFAIPLPSGLQATLQQGAKPANSVSGDLQEMLTGPDGLHPAFSAELHALLLNMSPQMLQRLESLVAGGIELPQAARQLLGEFAAAPMAGSFEERPLASANSDGGRSGLPVFVKAPALPQLAQMIPGPATAEVIATGFPPPGTHHLGVDWSFRNGLSPQLTSSLLDMGIPQTVGGRSWPGALAERVVWMAQGDHQFARLTLNPPQLGPLEVRVSVSQDQASVTFVAAHAAVREALEAAMPRLREMLDQQSLALVHAEVADPGAQQREAEHGPVAGQPTQEALDRSDQRLDDDAGRTPSLELPVGKGLVDLFA